MGAYLQGVKFGERSIIVYCRENEFDFTKLIDTGFRSLMTNYLSLDNMTDLVMVFLSEGQKSLFRYNYAILKLHKNFIKSGKDLLTLVSICDALESRSRDLTPTDELHKIAFNYKMLTAAKYEFSK
jgi:hypothetical protein